MRGDLVAIAAPDLRKSSEMDDAALGATLAELVERGLIIELEAFDWNCPRYITPRFTLTEIEPSVTALKARIAELEAALARNGSSTQ